MKDGQAEYKLSMGIPNGIILSLIGALVLATPLATTPPITGGKLAMDLIAGSILVVGGLISLAYGLKQRTHLPTRTDDPSHSDNHSD